MFYTKKYTQESPRVGHLTLVGKGSDGGDLGFNF